VAVADADPQWRTRSTAGNVPGAGAPPGAIDTARVYATAAELLEDRAVEAVSVCVPTPLHPKIASEALAAGRHILVEKPLALRSREADALAREAQRRPGLVCMPAMCMRFWPGWSWLRTAVAETRYGAVRSATFTRLAAVPGWGGGFYGDPQRSGGAILDLHVHDADFVRSCFGDPAAVRSTGVRGPGGGIDHVWSVYRFDAGPQLVAAEGGWLAPAPFPFTMQYRVVFEDAAAEFSLGRPDPLLLHRPGRDAQPVELAGDEGYTAQASYFLDCIEQGAAPRVVTMQDGVEAVRLIEAERASVESGEEVPYAGRDAAAG
jgi:predicted dehydrogenase